MTDKLLLALEIVLSKELRQKLSAAWKEGIQENGRAEERFIQDIKDKADEFDASRDAAAAQQHTT